MSYPKLEPGFGLDVSVFMQVIAGGDKIERVALAYQLARLLASDETPEADRRQVLPVVLKLAVDTERPVRKALADGLVNVADLDPDILFSIIADDDDLALPFLARTPALTHWHLLAVLRVGDEARQACVTLRPDISGEAVDIVVKSSALPVALLLFENKAAILSVDHYYRLYERFGQSGDMVECLLARADLPLDIRILQARRAANRMHQLMAERGWMPANDAAELVADAEESAVLAILTRASDAELAQVVGFLLQNSMLTPSIILRAACLGEMGVVEQALADLADIPRRRAQELMRGKGLTGFRGLHGKSGLPTSCFWILQAACDVAMDEAELGITLSPDDFGRQLIEALMTRYDALPLKERSRHLDYVGRFAAERARAIAQRLKSDLARAA